MPGGIRGVLFDLDGTLIDSAPDLAAAANDLLRVHGRPPVAFEKLRAHAGSGARGMLSVAFGLKPGDSSYDELRDAFYTHYESRLLQSTCFFGSIPAVLDELDVMRMPWGIVTNKAMRFVQPTAKALGLGSRSAALVAGDTTPYTKPHPAPLIEAARQMALEPRHCVYVGDDPRDVQAGRGAGMSTLAAAWGYLGPDLAIEKWGADQVLDQPKSLLQWLQMP